MDIWFNTIVALELFCASASIVLNNMQWAVISLIIAVAGLLMKD